MIKSKIITLSKLFMSFIAFIALVLIYKNNSILNNLEYTFSSLILLACVLLMSLFTINRNKKIFNLIIKVIYIFANIVITLLLDLKIVNTLILVASILMLDNVLKSSKGKNYSFTFLLLSLVFLPIFQYYCFTLKDYEYIFLFSFIIYIYSHVLVNDIGRKINLIIFFLVGIIVAYGINYSLIFVLLYLSLMADIFLNVKIKYSIRFISISLISAIITLFLLKCNFNITFISINNIYQNLLNTFNGKINFNILDLNYYFIVVTYILIIISLIFKINPKDNVYIYIFNILLILSLFLIEISSISIYILLYLIYLISLIDIVINILNSKIRYVNIYKLAKKYSKKQLKNVKKVSVIIPNYNYENYIIERIDSVLFQTYPIYELIILDDCSKDNSINVINEKIKLIKNEYKDLIVKFIPNQVNGGNVFKQWNKAFKEAKGDYVWIAEADDSCSPKFLENIMHGFKNDNIVISYCESLTMNQNNKILMQDLREWIDIFKTGKWEKSYINNGINEIKTCFSINNTLANVSSAVFKNDKNIDFSKYLDDARGYRLSGDWYFYVKVLEHGDIAYCNKSLNYHRMHNNSVTLTTNPEIEYAELCKIQDIILNTYKLSKITKERIENRRRQYRNRTGVSHEEIELQNIPYEEIVTDDSMLLSIIVPVYNTYEYLDNCLKSLLKNLPIKTEVIIVNDGTKDNSEEIILKYQEKYPEIIKYYKKENGGLSSAKNFGLEKATGKYIGFLDSDDWVSSNMYSSMLKKALIEDLDIVYCNIEMIFEDGQKSFINTTNSLRKDEFMAILDTPLMPASWSKLVKKELFDGLEYPIGINNEDVAVSPILFGRSKKTGKINSCFYKYFQRTGSIQNSGFSEKRFHIFSTAKICFEHAECFSIDKQEKIKGSIYTHQLLAILIYLISNIEDKNERIRFIKKFNDSMNEFKDWDKNIYVIEYLKKLQLSKLAKNMKINEYKTDEYLCKKLHPKTLSSKLKKYYE